jgi:polyisoprenyl-phosphate glycosyltransferase
MTADETRKRGSAVRISVVIPVYNEEGNIGALTSALGKILERYGDYELLFVDDGSADGSLAVLRGLAASDRRIRYISFSRNFGHQAALRAGLEAVEGDCVVTMDGDFQHPPALIPKLVAGYENGFDIVSTTRLDPPAGTRKRGSCNDDSEGKRYLERPSLLKRITSRLFYSLVNALSDIHIEPGSADFRLLSKRAKDALLSMKESNLFLRGAIPWIGLPHTEIAYMPEKRMSGTSKYTISKMFSLALNGMTSFSVKPLRLTSFAGLAISCAGFLYALYAVTLRLFTTKTVEGWTSILISILIIGGIQLLSLGIIGEYLGKLFMEAKGRPRYIVKEMSRHLEEKNTGEKA